MCIVSISPSSKCFTASLLELFSNRRTIYKLFQPWKSSERELVQMALLDAISSLHFHFTLAILSCILPFRSSPLALACAAADLYFSSLCCNASSTVFGCCGEAWNKTDSEIPHDSHFKMYELPFSSPSLPSSETKTSLQSYIMNKILLKKVY